MKNIKEWNWNQIGWRTLQSFIILVLQSPLLYYVINSVMGIGPLYEGDYVFVKINGELEKVREMVPLWDSFDVTDWEFWVQWLSLFTGILLTILFIKLLWTSKQKKLYFEKEQEAENKRNEALINAIKEQKKQDKEKKDVSKYL